MNTIEEMRRHLTDKAVQDDEFRNRLLSEPRTTIEDELDLKVPDGFNIQVHEDSAQTAHLILPPSPKLSETQLAQATGGKGPVAHFSAY